MDDLDRAKELEMEHRQRSIDAALSAPDKGQGEQQRIDTRGRVICIDCTDIIPKERLKARPDAVRCIYCKQDWERKHK
ncbi:MAG: TraR/DksA C4-type zinc finger protein [Gammaproteobacteria bacterium]|nr:TraR/DksA C4-type zinc finger protein [Gammaproteobacteria bacterium]